MPHLTAFPDVKRVYLIGICGTAMASLAGMLQERGFIVSGSDEHVYPPMSTYLESLGITALEGYTKQHVETFRPDLVVVGNVAAITNAEAAATLELEGNLAAADDNRLSNIERALQKIADGTYGLSDGSGAPISLERLEASPEALYTLEEQKSRDVAR